MVRFGRALGALFLMAVLATAAAGAQSAEGGANLYATMQTALSSKTAVVGDQFTMLVTEPFPNGIDLTGATIAGHVSRVVRAGQGTKPELELAFDRLAYADGTSVPISAGLTSLQMKTESKNGLDVAAKTLGGMLLGNAAGKTILGASGGASGALGAIGGFLYAQNTKTNVDVNVGSQAQLTLAAPLKARRQAQ